MNKLSREKQAQSVAALVEDNSINSTVRMTGVSKITILKLIKLLPDSQEPASDAHNGSRDY